MAVATAGKKSKLYASGTSTSFTAEATTRIGSTNNFQINTLAKRKLDPAAALTVKVGGVAQPASALTFIDPYRGIFYFASLPGAAVTIDGSYLPTIQVANISAWSLSAKSTILDDTAMGATVKSKKFGLKDASGDFSGFDPLVTVIDSAAGAGHKSILDWFNSEDLKLIELDSDGSAAQVGFSWIILPALDENSAVSSLVTRKITWEAAIRELAGLAVKTSPAIWGPP